MVSEPIFPQNLKQKHTAAMTETRSQALAKGSVSRDLEAANASRFEAIEKAIALQNEKSAQLDENVRELIDVFKQMSNTMPMNTSTSGEAQNRDGANGGDNHQNEIHRFHPYGHRPNPMGITRLTKIDFPRFYGNKIKEWFGKAEQFFLIDNTPEEAKVGIASMHFDGEASTWHQALMQEDDDALILRSWRGYKIRLKERFEEIFDDPMAELKELRETYGIADYNAKFELIRTRLKLSKEYLTCAYLAGLHLDTQMHVRTFHPRSTRQCLVLGRLYEAAHPKKEVKSNWSMQKSQFPSNTPRGLITMKKEETQKKEWGGKMKPFLSQAEMSERRAKGLCYYCDEKYTPEHYLKHKKTQQFSLDGEEDEEDWKDAETGAEEQTEVGDIAQISISAVAGVSDYNTMRVKGLHGKKHLYVLIDSGSTHNFMDKKVAELLGCRLLPTGKTRVSVADGSMVEIFGKIEKFKWQFQGNHFQADFMVKALGCHDIVLGVQWLRELGPITWDFQELTMQFRGGSGKIMLHGIQNGSVREVKSKRLEQLKEKDIQLHMVYAYEESEKEQWSVNVVELNAEEEVRNNEVEKLIEEYQCIFQEPTTLPPFRVNHNHKITLLEGSNPVNQKPYRYAVYQKDEIDKTVKELLTAGTIQPSSSPYASPVVLVKKKDGTWRVCVDYRKLNGMTIKDRFSIPLIEDLMDELGGSCVYSKIDLRAGYHQVRMATEDIHKTAFRTHNGHYEYLLGNAVWPHKRTSNISRVDESCFQKSVEEVCSGIL